MQLVQTAETQDEIDDAIRKYPEATLEIKLDRKVYYKRYTIIDKENSKKK